MISIIADTHTHTLACDHAYSTLLENVEAAARKGLKAIAMTEHAPAMTGGPSALYFGNLYILPRYIRGVMLLKGAEVNIMDYEGALDLPDRILETMEWAIASYHTPTLSPATETEHTRGWMHIANDPRIHVIGHCGDPRYRFDMETVVREFARTGKIVEINNHSFAGRRGSGENCRRVAELCAEHGVPIVVSSDAHLCEIIGCFDTALAMLEEIGFPEALILNADYDRFLAAARKTSSKELTDEI